MLLVIIFLSILLPSISILFYRRRHPLATDPAGLGFWVGLLPMAIAALWFLYFILRYHHNYGYHEMQLMDGFVLLVFLLIPVMVPLFANRLWKRSSLPLMKQRLGLVLALVLLFVLYFMLPLTWNFTFVLFPFSLLVMVLGFTLFRRKPLAVDKSLS